MDTAINNARRAAMATIANAPPSLLAAAMTALDTLPAYEIIRKPETGLAMVRGRVGGTGAAFNLGEATVTRAAVRLACGTEGFAHHLGRDHRKAELAAVVDALWQRPDQRERIEREVLTPLRAAQAASDTERAAKVAATRVEFFTLQRGEA